MPPGTDANWHSGFPFELSVSLSDDSGGLESCSGFHVANIDFAKSVCAWIALGFQDRRLKYLTLLLWNQAITLIQAQSERDISSLGNTTL